VSEGIFVGAPQGQRWPLSIDDAETQLRARFPDAILQRRTSGVTGEPYLSFTVDLADGMPRHGVYAEGRNLALSDGTPADWADTIAWFIRLLPAGTPMLAMVEANPTPVPIPEGTSTPDTIRQLLEDLS
jgi:hypothetical protein